MRGARALSGDGESTALARRRPRLSERMRACTTASLPSSSGCRPSAAAAPPGGRSRGPRCCPRQNRDASWWSAFVAGLSVARCACSSLRWRKRRSCPARTWKGEGRRREGWRHRYTEHKGGHQWASRARTCVMCWTRSAASLTPSVTADRLNRSPGLSIVQPRARGAERRSRRRAAREASRSRSALSCSSSSSSVSLSSSGPPPRFA